MNRNAIDLSREPLCGTSRAAPDSDSGFAGTTETSLIDIGRVSHEKMTPLREEKSGSVEKCERTVLQHHVGTKTQDPSSYHNFLGSDTESHHQSEHFRFDAKTSHRNKMLQEKPMLRIGTQERSFCAILSAMAVEWCRQTSSRDGIVSVE